MSQKPVRKRRRLQKMPRLMDTSSSVIAVIDGEFQILYANNKCCDWLGVESGELIGSRLSYSLPEQLDTDDNQSGITGLCPPPELFEKDRPHFSSGFVYSSRKKVIWKSASFTRIANQDDVSSIILIVASGPDLQQLPEQGKSTTKINIHNLLAHLAASDQLVFSLSSLVGTSDHASLLRRQVQAAAENSADCLITGPRGSGREHVARTIFSERKLENANLIPVHCAIADSQFIQDNVKNWMFDQRQNKTFDWLLLLDVDQLSAEGQNELLGYTRLPDFKMRIIATAEKNLLDLAKAGQYSTSLAMHLSVQSIRLAPLTARKSDIPMLAQAFVESLNTNSDRQISGFSDEVAELLCEYSWPGNTAELRQLVEQAFEKCNSSVIQSCDLPDEFRHSISALRIGQREVRKIDMEQYLAGIEQELIQRAMQQAGNNKTQAAKLLGISRAKLLRKLTSIGLESGDNVPAADNLVDQSAFREAD